MALDEHEFAARWSSFVWAITVGGIGAAVLAGAAVISVAVHEAQSGAAVRLALVAAALGPAVVVGIVGLFAPRAYVLTRDAIVIQRWGRAVVILRDRVREVRRIRSDEVGLAWRLFGSGGLFGSFGLFYSRSLGKFWVYVTNQEDLVLVTQVDGTKIVISPYPAHGFLDAVRKTEVENA
jgi:hypothetical protein